MSTWLARWRVALRIARRDAWRHKMRTALVVAMIALPLMAGTAVTAFVRTAEGTPAGEVAARLGPAAQARVSLAPCAPYLQEPSAVGGGCLDEQHDPLPIDLESLRSVMGVEHAVQPALGGVDLVSDTAALSDYFLTEVDRTDDLARLAGTSEGRLPESSGEVAIPAQAARRLGVEIGDSVTLAQGEQSVDATLVGYVDMPKTDQVVALAGTTPSDWTIPTSWMVLDDDPVTWNEVLAANEQGWEVFSRDVVLNPPPRDQVPFWDTFPETGGTDLSTVGLVGAVLAMGLLEIALLIGPAFAIGARRNARQLAVAAASGASPADLRRIVLATGVVAGAFAAVVGIGIGLVLSFFGMLLLIRFAGGGSLGGLVLPTWELSALTVVALVLGVGAAWIPARTAASRDVVASLAGRKGEARPARGLGRLGVALGVLGILGMLLGVVTSQPAGLVAGVVVLEIGVILASGAIVVGLGRIAPRFGFAGRFAIRDSARHRSRTAPAVAAVLAAVAAATAGGIYLQGESVAQRGAWRSLAEEPALVLRYGGGDDSTLADSATGITSALERIEAEIETVAALPIYVGYPRLDPETGDEVDPTMGLIQSTYVQAEYDPDLVCDGESDDPRCPEVGEISSGLSFPGVVIDDGTLMAAAGLPGWQEAVDVLEQGGVVVESAALWPDGTAHLVRVSGPSADTVTTQVPAYGSDWSVFAYSVVLSPEAAGALGLAPVAVGGLVTTTDDLPQAEVDRLNGIARGEAAALSLRADREKQEGIPTSLVLVAVATLIALAAVGLAVGLAGADTAPDLATLSAVGAAPGVRRRIAAAQAGVIAGTGAVLGVITGIPIGLLLSLWAREQSGYGDGWPLTVPWPILLGLFVVPVVAMGVTWTLTRSRLPMVRRLAE